MPAVAAALVCGLVACADLPPLGTCGNGVVEATAGEDCDDPDPATCSACRLVCTEDLPDDGICTAGAQCCLAGQRCGVDGLCRAPSGVFAGPSAAIPFKASELEVADVDGDAIGDVFGINRQQASFLFGTDAGELTRTGSAPIPTLSRPESQVAFLAPTTSADAVVVAEGTASVVVPTPRGFAVLVASGGRMFSPPLPELEFSGAAGQALAAAPSATGSILAVVEDDASGRVAVRAFVDRIAVANDLMPCDQTMLLAPGVSTVVQLAVTGTLVDEHAVIAITRYREDPSTLEAAALCVYATAPVSGTDPLVIPLSPGVYVAEVRSAQLDADTCPEVVAELVLPDPNETHRVVYYDTDPGGGDCVAGATGVIADGPLLGTGDLVGGDGDDEVMVGRDIFTDILGVQNKLGYTLPEALVRAIVVDVNRDFAPDIVAIGDAPDLTVVLRVPGGYAPRTVASSGALRELVTADFDADTFPDVATVETLAGGSERVVVAFGGPFGPQALDGIGAMQGPHGLVAFIDRVPAPTSDAFADLFLISTGGQGIAEASQFNGSGTRALTSQIDLSAAPPAGDGGLSFGRSTIGGELLRPRGDGTDFCTLSMQTMYPPGDPPFDVVNAFCVGGQGAMLSAGALDDQLAFTTGGLVGAVGTMPLFVAAEVGARSNGEPFPVIAALRRDGILPPKLVIMALPPSGEPDAIASAVLDVFAFPDPPPPYARQIYVATLHVAELDGDPDSELLVTLFDFVFQVGDAMDITFRSLVYRVDLAAPGNAITAVATELIDHTGRDCGDAALIELGSVIPGGGELASVPGPELVVLCADAEDGVARLYAFHRGPDGLVGPFVVGYPADALGTFTVGDVTGDRLDDLVILYGAEGETRVAVMAQCAAHDTACAPSSVGSK